MVADRPKRAVAIEPAELEQMLRGQVASVVAHLLPNGREDCGYWRVGSLAGEPGNSLAVNLHGPLRGCWTDFAAPDKTPERSGDLLWLAARTMFGGRLGDAITWAISWLNLDGLDPGRLKKEKALVREQLKSQDEQAARAAEEKRRKALGLYLQATPLAGTLAETYLISRGIDLRAADLVAPGSIKFHPAVPCVEAGKGADKRVIKLPCMVAAIVSLAGQHVATHRTWLRSDGMGKEALIEPKKVMGRFAGGFIPLWKGASDKPMKDLPEGTPVLVSEGIEDGLSVALARPHHRIIAAVSLSNIGSLELPPQVGPLVIIGQHDTKQPAIDALERAVARQQEKGREVIIAYPPDGVKDMNDLLNTAEPTLGDLFRGDGGDGA